MTDYATTVINLMFPWVCIATPVALILVVLLRPLVRGLINDKRIDEHHCLACGYDLRKLPPGTLQCPECGRVLGKPPK
ncbi:MAG: hypothetical protein AAF085_11655 [Planctomycetota bacterium]